MTCESLDDSLGLMPASVALLVDFGSTYTKAVAVDLDSSRIVGRAQAPSTAHVGITVGLRAALKELQSLSGLRENEAALRLACSSARGGLRLVAVGLVPLLTTEAARRAAMGAGAKAIRVYSYELSRADVDELEALSPDIVLLAGGTDGGNKLTILRNAVALARSHVSAAVIVAGNRAAMDEVVNLLTAAGKQAYATENVMPDLDRLNVDPARQAIRDVFVRHIVQAKGLDRAMTLIDDVIMPTPAAVQEAARLLAEGTEGKPGLGELVVVDVGGATTDVFSVTRARQQPGYVHRGLPEPDVTRTVEGDLGLRTSAVSVLEAVRRVTPGSSPAYGSPEPMYPVRPELAARLETPMARERAADLAARPEAIPATAQDAQFDALLAATATDIAIGRHAGYERRYIGPMV